MLHIMQKTRLGLQGQLTLYPTLLRVENSPGFPAAWVSPLWTASLNTLCSAEHPLNQRFVVRPPNKRRRVWPVPNTPLAAPKIVSVNLTEEAMHAAGQPIMQDMQCGTHPGQVGLKGLHSILCAVSERPYCCKPRFPCDCLSLTSFRCGSSTILDQAARLCDHCSGEGVTCPAVNMLGSIYEFKCCGAPPSPRHPTGLNPVLLVTSNAGHAVTRCSGSIH